MHFRASHKHVRMSARKARLVVDLVRGKGINEALTFLNICSKRAAPLIRKVLESAKDTASITGAVDEGSLWVSEARVDEGPTYKRWRPRAMGRATPILKRTCHIHITLADGERVRRPGKKRRRRRHRAPRPAAAAANATRESGAPGSPSTEEKD